MKGERKRVQGAWDVGFHRIVDQARRDYSQKLGKNLTMQEVTRIWGEGRLAQFKIPPLKMRGEYAKRRR